MHSWIQVKNGRGLRPCSRVVENQYKDGVEGPWAIPPPVIKWGTDNDIANTATTQRTIARCGHCTALGAEKDQDEGRHFSGLG